MQIADAVKIVDEFFDQHLLRPEYWDETEQEILLSNQLVEGLGNEVAVTFAIDDYADLDDPELLALADAAMAALKEAHPELLPFELTYELWQ